MMTVAKLAKETRVSSDTIRYYVRVGLLVSKLKLDELQALQNCMETALRQWNDMPDGEPNGHCICYFIELVAQA